MCTEMFKKVNRSCYWKQVSLQALINPESFYVFSYKVIEEFEEEVKPFGYLIGIG